MSEAHTTPVQHPPSPLSEQRILVLHTGGTFGASLSLKGDHNDPATELLSDLSKHVPEIFAMAHISLKVIFQSDSSNLNPNSWAALCEVIQNEWAHHDGFVIIHGTDTLAYASSFVSLSLSDLSKPIVLTGSQRPLRERRSDARSNLIDAVELATHGFPEVMVCFDSDVHLACRVTKTSNLNLGAFRSPNFPQLGHFGVEPTFQTEHLPQPRWSTRPPRLDTRANTNVLSLYATPGSDFSRPLIEQVVGSASGLLIHGFGSGHVPTTPSGWLDLCEEAQKAHIPVLICSQCSSGRVDLDLYEVGRKLLERRVIPSWDMTAECSTVKLMMCLGRGVSYEDSVSFLTQPLAREISPSG